MTFAIFIVLVLGVFVALLNGLPAISAFPIDPTSAFSIIIGTLKAWDFFLPIHELLLLLGFTITFEISIWSWKISWSVVKFLRGHSDGS